MKKFTRMLTAVLMLALLTVGCSEKEEKEEKKEISFDDALENAKVADYVDGYEDYETVADIIEAYEALEDNEKCEIDVFKGDTENEMTEETAETLGIEYDEEKEYKQLRISANISFGSVGDISTQYSLLFSMDKDGELTPELMYCESYTETEPDEIIKQLCVELETLEMSTGLMN